jgi:hypothetical protein
MAAIKRVRNKIWTGALATLRKGFFDKKTQLLAASCGNKPGF